MSNAILIHGYNTKDEHFDASRPTPSNDHWFPWLTKQLMLKDIHTVALEMPGSYSPVYEEWKRELERYDIDEATTLVGYSCGGGFLLRWLSEADVKVGKVILVAPWLGYGADQYQEFDPTFFDFDIDRHVADKTSSLHVFVSSDDEDSIHSSVADILRAVDNVELHEFADKGHFVLSSLGSEAFPELLQVITDEQ